MPVLDANEITISNYLPGISGRFFKSENNSFSFTHFEKKAVSPIHKHSFEQVIIILKGEMEFLLEDKKHTMKKGGVMIVPSNICHQCTALTDCLLIEIFQHYE